MHVPEVVCHRLRRRLSVFHPIHPRRALQVFRAVGHWPIIATGQVVVGERFQVKLRVGLVRGAGLEWCLVEWICDEEVRAGQHPVLWRGGKCVVSWFSTSESAVVL